MVEKGREKLMKKSEEEYIRQLEEELRKKLPPASIRDLLQRSINLKKPPEWVDLKQWISIDDLVKLIRKGKLRLR